MKEYHLGGRVLDAPAACAGGLEFKFWTIQRK